MVKCKFCGCQTEDTSGVCDSCKKTIDGISSDNKPDKTLMSLMDYRIVIGIITGSLIFGVAGIIIPELLSLIGIYFYYDMFVFITVSFILGAVIGALVSILIIKSKKQKGHDNAKLDKFTAICIAVCGIVGLLIGALWPNTNKVLLTITTLFTGISVGYFLSLLIKKIKFKSIAIDSKKKIIVCTVVGAIIGVIIGWLVFGTLGAVVGFLACGLIGYLIGSK